MGKAKNVSVVRHNHKAFTFSGGVKSVHRRVQRTAEIQDKRLKVQKVTKQAETAPPFIVVVQGPPKSGKSTLIKSLVKHYTRRNITTLSGPITLISSLNRRLTLIECPSEMPYMLDASKIADLVIVLIDANYGYEMDTFEFINILQIHGFPRIIGVVTNLDKFTSDNKTLKKCKNDLKKRFWAEIYDGAKLFYLTKFKNNRYNKIEISNLARFISVQKPITLSWRTSHPYTLSLRHEMVEDAVYFYGYVYGGRFVTDQPIHIPGAGDFRISSIQDCTDPCPLPTVGKRTLQDKQRGIYAPGSDIGMVMFDDEDMYITLPNVKSHFTESISGDEENITDAIKMVRQLQKFDTSKTGVDEDFKLLPDHMEPVNGFDEDSVPSSYTGTETDQDTPTDEPSDPDEPTDEPTQLNDIVLKTGDDDIELHSNALMKLIYKPDGYRPGTLLGNHLDDINKDNDLFDPNIPDQRIFDTVLDGTTFEELLQSDHVKSLFKHTNVEPEGSPSESDEEKSPTPAAQDVDESDPHFITKKQKLDLEKQKEEYVETTMFKGIETVQDHLSSQFLGKYVKIGVKGIPKTWYDKVNKTSSFVVLSGLLPGESNFRHMLIRVKRHRWFPKILKNEDPTLFSIGWRRFQSLPLYCMEDRNKVRVRMLKYTPEHLHCHAVIYCPLVPPNTGVVGIKNWNKVKSYRISLTGVVLGEASDIKVVKKLKFIGEPQKIFKNTAFIKGMFNSNMEVSRCIGAKIQTVSGIRGVIKKAHGSDGLFRASFEDKIVPSDLIIMKSYVPVLPKTFYNPILDEGGALLRSISEIRSEYGISPSTGHPYPVKSSLEHPDPKFSTIKIPTNLVKNLPFKSRPKKISTESQIESLPVIKSAVETKNAAVLSKLMQIRAEKLEKRLEKIKLHKAKKAIETAKADQAKDAVKRERIKKRNVIESKKHSILRDKLAI